MFNRNLEKHEATNQSGSLRLKLFSFVGNSKLPKHFGQMPIPLAAEGDHKLLKQFWWVWIHLLACLGKE